MCGYSSDGFCGRSFFFWPMVVPIGRDAKEESVRVCAHLPVAQGSIDVCDYDFIGLIISK